MKKYFLFIWAVSLQYFVEAQDKTSTLFSHSAKKFTHADTLRGSNTPQRAWWDVIYYDLHVRIQPGDSSISGSNTILYRVKKPPFIDSDGGQEMQIDLMTPLQI